VREHIDRIVHDVATQFAPDVQWIRYSIESDWSGDHAVFFRINAVRRGCPPIAASKSARRVESVLSAQLEPLAPDLLFYYNYGSRSEQARIKEPAWSKG